MKIALSSRCEFETKYGLVEWIRQEYSHLPAAIPLRQPTSRVGVIGMGERKNERKGWGNLKWILNRLVNLGEVHNKLSCMPNEAYTRKDWKSLGIPNEKV
jgi:hypothetical protein